MKMIKNSLWIVIFILIISTAKAENFKISSKNADKQPLNQGCFINDKFYTLGSREQMNDEELKLYEKTTGFRASDGYAVMMQCIYIVNPLSDDHPPPEKRHYVWVAS